MKCLFRIGFCGLVAALLALGGCAKKAEEPPTVSWYKEHKAEREAKDKWCIDDAARAQTADCMNAAQALQETPAASSDYSHALDGSPKPAKP